MTDYTLEALQEQRQKLLEKVKVLDKKIAEKQKRQAQREAKKKEKEQQELGKLLLEDEKFKDYNLDEIKEMLAKTLALAKDKK